MSPRYGEIESIPVDALPLPPALSRALSSVALVDTTSGGAIEFGTPAAMALLCEYFPTQNGWYLPERLVRWLRQERASGPFVPPLLIQSGEKQLLVKAVGTEEGHIQLLLEEKSDRALLARLKALGLTSREAEVLLWIARGKGTIQIATILDCSCNTVAKHTQRILNKLGAESRTAAAVIALEIA